MRAFTVARISSVVLFCCLLVATGCTSTDDTPGTPETGDSPAAQASSSSPAPSSSTTAETSPTASASTPGTTPLVDRLLPAGQVPGLNATWTWQDGRTGVASTDPFDLCAKADLLSIGATDAVESIYFPPDDSDDSAGEQIAEFPDAKTTALAWAVLTSWHDACGKKRAAFPSLKVRPFVTVPVTAGSGRWYLSSWAPTGEETGRFEAVGMVRSGTRIAVLRMDSSGQDYNYAAGKEPMAGMVRAAAGWLD